MVKTTAKDAKNEPPDRGKASQKQNTKNLPKSPLRPAKTSLHKTSSPKPLGKERYASFSAKNFRQPQTSSAGGKTINKAIPRYLKVVQEANDQQTSSQIASPGPGSPLYTIKVTSKQKSKAKSSRKNPSITAINQENRMDCEEMQTPSPPKEVDAVTKDAGADELPERANSVAGLINKYSEEITSHQSSHRKIR